MNRPTGTKALLLSLLLILASAASVRADLQASIQQIVRAAELGNTEIGIYVVDLDTSKVLASIAPDELLIPASNMKVLTTAAALELLGPGFRFETQLRLIPPDQWPTPAGRPGPTHPLLVVRGDGDPAFGDPNILAAHGLDVEKLLNLWVDAVRKTSITRFSRLLIDDRVFDQQFIHPSWPADQLNQWYCAQVAGLTFNDNCLDVYASPTRPGQPPRVRLVPDAPFLQISNRAVTDSSDGFWISRAPGTNDLMYMGKVKTGMQRPVNVTLHDPPMFFGQLLAHRLGQAGITVDAIERPSQQQQLPVGKALHLVQSQLPLVLARCNKDSQNLFAECLIKRVGRQISGAPGSWDNGGAAIKAFLQAHLGAPATQVRIADGSGMSRNNLVTARVLAGVLQAMHDDPDLGPIFRETLSVGGSDGTLRNRFKDLRSTRVLGKSGYINSVSSLSGYVIHVDSPDGALSMAPQRTIAFSLLFNNFRHPVNVFQIKAVQDKIVGLIAAHLATQQREPALIGG